MNPNVVEIKEQDKNSKCNFCDRSEVNSLLWGPMYQLEGITTHYFCMLFSAGLSQCGEDEEGILGFLPRDITKELNRGKKLKCKYCRSARATVGCSNKKCKNSFHYPCGLEKGSVFQFIKNFESYCMTHKTKVPIPVDKKLWECPICYTKVTENDDPLWPPCCKKAVFHRKCIMEMAIAHGSHFFKCPLCNDKEEFTEAMRFGGVYVPERDAAWELEPNAFSDLNRQHNRCDAPVCECPKGREYSATTKDESKWRIVRCGGCGAEAVHKQCGKLILLTYRCDMCASVLAGTAAPDPESEDEDLPSQRSIERARYETRIIRRTYETSDDDLPTNRLKDLVSNDKYSIENASNSDSETSSSSFSEITGVIKRPPIVDRFGRTYKVMGMDDDDDDSCSESDDSDEDLEKEDNSVSISTSKDISWIIKFRTNNFGLKKSNNNTIVDDLNNFMPIMNRFKIFQTNLDKIRKDLSEQITDNLNREDNDNLLGQSRTGLVVSSLNNTQDNVNNLLKANVQNINSGPSMRQLCTTARLPNVETSETEDGICKESVDPEMKKSIDKVASLFKASVLQKSDSQAQVITNLKNIKGFEDAKISLKKKNDVSKPEVLPVIQKIVSKFAEDIKEVKESKVSPNTNPRGTLKSVKDNSDSDPTFLMTVSPPNLNTHQSKLDKWIKSPVKQPPDSKNDSLFKSNPSPSYSSNKHSETPLKTISSSMLLSLAGKSPIVKKLFVDQETNCQVKNPLFQNNASHNDSFVILTDSEDENDCVVIEEGTSKKSNFDQNKTEKNEIETVKQTYQILEESDDEIEIEVIKLIKQENTENMPTNSSSLMRIPVATAYNELQQNIITKSEPCKYFSGKLSAALIANSASMSKNSERQKTNKTNKVTKTGPTSDTKEIVILDSSDDDVEDPKKNTSGEGNSLKCSKQPNRDENENTTSSSKKRSRACSDSEGSDSERVNCLESKRQKIVK